ncbi:YmdB family metallophosphoesterase, partial [Candidatus Falkowbacteria bacterium]|nr:YmdB family metallophosphoesterase [Candidatus Falkowbacteria bacterium]
IGSYNVLFINLLGELFMKDEVSNPFVEIKKILKVYEDKNIHATFVDFHAETTSEKMAFGYSVDGKVSCVFGTHTHIPTADERILPHGTGYVTDVGFCGPLDSVIGVQIDPAIHNFTHHTKARAGIVESGAKFLNALHVRIDTQTGTCTHIQRISKMYN